MSDMENGKTTGQRIRAARKEAKLSQAELACRMGVTNHCISMWERGKRNPKYDTLSRIADAIGVNVNRFLPAAEVSQNEVADRAKPKWISVKERLPENNQWALCLMKDGYFRVFQWNYIDWMWNDTNEWYREEDVTHWMPLPEPPKGDDSDADNHN